MFYILNRDFRLDLWHLGGKISNGPNPVIAKEEEKLDVLRL